MYLRPVEGAILEISSYQINFQLLNLFTLFKKQKTLSYSSAQIKIYKFTGFKFKLYCTYAQKLLKQKSECKIFLEQDKKYVIVFSQCRAIKFLNVYT